MTPRSPDSLIKERGFHRNEMEQILRRMAQLERLRERSTNSSFRVAIRRAIEKRLFRLEKQFQTHQNAMEVIEDRLEAREKRKKKQIREWMLGIPILRGIRRAAWKVRARFQRRKG